MYRALKETAEREGRVVLTSDKTFVRARYCEHTFHVQSQTKQEQLKEVLKVAAHHSMGEGRGVRELEGPSQALPLLKVRQGSRFSRCSAGKPQGHCALWIDGG